MSSPAVAGSDNSFSGRSSNQQQDSPKDVTMMPDPVFCLSMRSGRSCPPSVATDIEDAKDRVQVMLNQERDTYKCRDYLRRRQLEKPTKGRPQVPHLLGEEAVDSLCREKMCDWSYRVCDHFYASREIVAISFSYLDRFIDLCNCDRTAFKLAAMTTLYMATKLFNSRQLSISGLAELSRGEFSMAHIVEMEGIILKTLGWRLNPPTVQAFINHMYMLLPATDEETTRAIYQRAVFFAELSLYDYGLATKERSLLAVAAILNSMEGMDESLVPRSHLDEFQKSIGEILGITYSASAVDSARHRLWYIYSMSSQYHEDDALPVVSAHVLPNKPSIGRELSGVIHSPICVGNSQ